MQVITVTIGSGATPFLPAAVTPDKVAPFQMLLISYTGSGSAYIGDSKVSSTNGIAITSTSAPLQIVQALSYGNDLNEFYVYGTQGQKITVMVIS